MKKLFLMFCFLLSLPLMAQTASNTTLVLWHADGTTTDVELYTQPLVTFTADKLLVSSPIVTLEYPADEILRFTYKGKGTGVSLPKREADYSQSDGKLVFNKIAATDRVAVYTANGIRVPVRLVAYGDGFALPLSSIPQGIYILSVNGRTSKFTKR